MLLKRIIKIWQNYFVGQFFITAFIFIASWGAGFLTGLRYSLLNAIAAGICECIPNIGPVISAVISGILALVFGSSKLDLQNWQFMILIVICTILIQLLQNWLISPLIIGKKMELHPLIVLLGMIVFSFCFGVWGMILAVPILGTVREIYRFNKEQKEDDKLENLLQ